VQDATECIRYLRTNNFAVDVLLVDMHLGETMTGSGKNSLALLNTSIIPNHIIIIYRYILYILFSGYSALTPHHTNSSYPPLFNADLTRELRTTYGLTRPLIIGLNRDRAGVEEKFVASGGDAAWGKPLPPVGIVNARLLTLMHARAMLSSLQEG